MKKNLLSPKAPCPCQSEKTYSDCCRPWHMGLDTGEHAPQPADLMRARYSAYSLGLIDYLLATWHPSTAPGELELAPIKWIELRVLHARTDRDAGVVEFVARYREGGRAGSHHEISRFVRQDGRWFYIDGQIMDAGSDEHPDRAVQER